MLAKGQDEYKNKLQILESEKYYLTAMPRGLKMQDFDVSPECGFLPSEFPLEKLPQEYYQPWETLMASLPALLLCRRIRPMVEELPILSTKELKTVPEQRRAYQVLGFLSHAYIWGGDKALNRLPKCLAEPWIQVASDLGLPPISTYANLCLWNFKQIVPNKDPKKHWDMNNLTSINTFTGSTDETWFYLVSVYLEHAGAALITQGLKAIDAVEQDNPRDLLDRLQSLAELIDDLGSVLMRMQERCDPHVFYHKMRPFFAGWTNMTEAGLDVNGVFYGDETEPRVYAGGSNGQSSLIQFLDVLLDVVHYKTGERPVGYLKGATSNGGYNSEMRAYMPQKHREFLSKVGEITRIREYVLEKGSDTPGLVLAYDACLSMLKLFRDKHIRIVTRYVIIPAKLAPGVVSATGKRPDMAKDNHNGTTAKGTGGTSLLPFLKQCRDETGDPAAGSWGKKILGKGIVHIKAKPTELQFSGIWGAFRFVWPWTAKSM